MKNLNRTNLIAVRALLVGTLDMLTGEKVVKLKDVKTFAFEYLDKLIAGEADKEAASDIFSIRCHVSASGQRLTLERSLRFIIARIDTQIDALNALGDNLQSAIDAPLTGTLEQVAPLYGKETQNQPSMVTLNGNRAPRQTLGEIFDELDAMDAGAWCNGRPVTTQKMLNDAQPQGVTTQKMLDDGAAVHEEAGQFWKDVARLNVPVEVAREIAIAHPGRPNCAMHDLVIASAQNIVKELYVGIVRAQCDYLFNPALAQAPAKHVALETAIIKTILEDVLAAGYGVVVAGEDGPEHDDVRTDFNAVWPVLFAQDWEDLLIYADAGEGFLHAIGFITFMHGNGEDVISDNTAKPAIERLMVRGSHVAEMIRAVEYADA